jgi:hypothetical protein
MPRPLSGLRVRLAIFTVLVLVVSAITFASVSLATATAQL